MAELDPAIADAFRWTGSLTYGELAADSPLLERVRSSYDTDPAYSPPECQVERLIVPGPQAGEVPIRIYRPAAGEKGSASLVWVHGGGFMSGSLDQREADGVARELATRAGAVVITVGYTLANGGSVTYPRLHQEVAAATEWVRAHGDELGVDPSRIALGGASAGANLALGAALEARDLGRPLVAKLLLVYPLSHRTTPAPASGADLRLLPSLLRIPQSMVDTMFAVYLGAGDGSTPYASIEGHDLAGLPPCLVVVSEYDDLRPSGEETVARLRAAGVEAEYYLAAGTIHGHLSLSGTTTETDRTLSRLADYIRGGWVDSDAPSSGAAGAMS